MSLAEKIGKNMFYHSRIFGVVINAFNFVSGVVFDQVIRCYASVTNAIGNSFGVVAARWQKKHENWQEEIADTKPSDPITMQDFERYVGTNTMVRNWVANSPRVVGNLTYVASGLSYGREGEAISGLINAALAAIPLLKFDSSYKVSACAGMVAAIATMHSGHSSKDPWQFSNGATNFLFWVTQLFVENKVQNNQGVGDTTFVEKLKYQMQNCGVGKQ